MTQREERGRWEEVKKVKKRTQRRSVSRKHWCCNRANRVDSKQLLRHSRRVKHTHTHYRPHPHPNTSGQHLTSVVVAERHT